MRVQFPIYVYNERVVATRRSMGDPMLIGTPTATTSSRLLLILLLLLVVLQNSCNSSAGTAKSFSSFKKRRGRAFVRDCKSIREVQTQEPFQILREIPRFELTSSFYSFRQRLHQLNSEPESTKPTLYDSFRSKQLDLQILLCEALKDGKEQHYSNGEYTTDLINADELVTSLVEPKLRWQVQFTRL